MGQVLSSDAGLGDGGGGIELDLVGLLGDGTFSSLARFMTMLLLFSAIGDLAGLAGVSPVRSKISTSLVCIQLLLLPVSRSTSSILCLSTSFTTFTRYGLEKSKDPKLGAVEVFS